MITTTESSKTGVDWEADVAGLLGELSQLQDELLAVLTDKRRALVETNTEALGDVQRREESIISRLEACHLRRGELLELAQREGLPSDSIGALVGALADDQQVGLRDEVTAARRRARLLQHHSLTNWVLAQRAVLHLSQMLEIIATGGRGKPTYGDMNEPSSGGALVDRAA